MMNAKQLTRMLALALCATGAALAPTSEAAAQSKRVDLQVLVISATDVGTDMVKAGLDEGFVPYTEVKLGQANRPIINDAFLATKSAFLQPRRAKFQAVVLPNEAPAGLSAAERDALKAFQREFKIRQLDSYIYPSPAVNMNWPADPGYIGSLDGFTAQVNGAGKSAGFQYLNGPVPFDDISPTVLEQYGALATPLPANTTTKQSFTPLVEMTIPGTSTLGTVVGVFNDNGREEMVITAAINQYQVPQQLLFPGILNWLTYGVHVGTERNFLAVHIDDVFLGDARWSIDNNCTVGDDCPPSVVLSDIIMSPADVDYLVAWQNRQGLKLDMYYNGAGYDEAIALNRTFPLGARLLANKAQFRWANHTYTHAYLGCVQDFSVQPWRCKTVNGSVQWTPYDAVYGELKKNIDFATRFKIAITSSELVTGEHSGLRRAPQEPSDNPNLISALNALRFAYVGSDNSRESAQRKLGSSALSVPRYPMSVYYNTGTKAEAADEYNWIYNSRADGGSGLCENNPSSTCIAPLDINTGYDSYVVPLEARALITHVMSNSPRPHYAHQSNLAEDRTLYPVLDAALASYRAAFATNTPFVNLTTTEAGKEFANRTAWTNQRSSVSAFIQDGRVYVQVSGFLSTVNVPFTAPGATTGGALTPYGGNRNGWMQVRSLLNTQIPLPSSVLIGR